MSIFSSRKFLTPSELDDLKVTLAYTPEHRDALLLRTLLFTGARAQEALNLTDKDLLEESKSVYIRGLKRSLDREIPVSDQLFMQLLSLPKGRLFPISYDTLRRIWLRYRPCEKPVHSLRHTFAVTVYRHTKDLSLVKSVLGHRNIQNTMIYASFLHTQSEVRKLLLG